MKRVAKVSILIFFILTLWTLFVPRATRAQGEITCLFDGSTCQRSLAACQNGYTPPICTGFPNGDCCRQQYIQNGTCPQTIACIQTSCTYDISPTSANFPINGGTRSVQVTAGSGCSWTASTGVSWITITSGASGTGNGTVNYTISANNGVARNGSLTIANNSFNIAQAGQTQQGVCNSPNGCFFCSYTTGQGCYWDTGNDSSTCSPGYFEDGTLCPPLSAGSCTSTPVPCVTNPNRYRCVASQGCTPCAANDNSPDCVSFASCTHTCNNNTDPNACNGTCRTSCRSGEIAGAGTCVASEPICCEVPPNSSPALCNGNTGINSAIGCIPVNNTQAFAEFILAWGIGVAGGIAFLLIIYAGFLIVTSAGNPQKVAAGKELLTAALSGLILIILSAFILRVIGVDILGIFNP